MNEDQLQRIERALGLVTLAILEQTRVELAKMEIGSRPMRTDELDKLIDRNEAGLRKVRDELSVVVVEPNEIFTA